MTTRKTMKPVKTYSTILRFIRNAKPSSHLCITYQAGNNANKNDMAIPRINPRIKFMMKNIANSNNKVIYEHKTVVAFHIFLKMRLF